MQPTLDPEQKRAVDHRAGPCLVVAGPGSGKTRVIVERFLQLVAEGVPPEAQLVLTYTRRAAGEMRARAEAAHGPFAGEQPLSNYHSFAQRVVRDWGWLADISPAFRIPDEAERWLHLEAVLAALRPRTLWNPLRPHDLVDPLLDLIGKAKQELVTPERYGAWAADRLRAEPDAAERALLERHHEVAAVYAALDERYLRHAVLDFDDTIRHATTLLQEHEPARHAVCDAIRYVMVDEYQDTNFAQARLVETLVEGHHNLLVVADDDQAIYKFRGASLANLRRFEQIYPDHARVVLSRNYRSTAQVVAVSTAVIGAADPASRIGKTLTAARGDGVAVEAWDAADERSEVLAIAAECRALMDSGVAAGDIAWLFRRHADMRAALGALREVGVPYLVQGGRGFFTQPEVKDLLALLAAAADPRDSQSILRCLHMPAWRVGGSGRLAIVDACDSRGATVHDCIASGACALDEADAAAAVRCIADIDDLNAMSARADVRDVFHEALQRSRFLGLLDERDELARMQVGANLNKFGELLEGFADWSDDRRLVTALRYLEVLRNCKQADELAAVDSGEDGVTVLTAHAAKGLEWRVVFVSGCVESRWPGRGGASPSSLQLPPELVDEMAPPHEAVIEEERRLFYVAISRARDRLVLSRARRYPRSFRDEPPSPFLAPVAATGAVTSRDVDDAPPLHPHPPRVRGRARVDRLDVGVSDIRVFKECPRRFEYRRRYRMPAPVSVRGWYGTLIHGVMQNAAMRRIAGAEVGPDDIAAIWDDAWQAATGFKASHPELRALGERQLRRYAMEPAWREARIGAVEESFTLSLDRADVRGRWDRLDLRDDGRVTVVDYKTGAPGERERLRSNLQVRAYAVAAARRDHVDAVDVELHHMQTAEVTMVGFTREQLSTADRHLNASASDLAAACSSGDFPPRPSAWICPRCEFRTVCDEGRGAG